MAISELAEEIIFDIFSRLPVKSVGKCRCLSKSWRITLSSPEFIKSHLNRKTLNQQNLLLITPSNSIHTIADIKSDAVSRKLELPDNWIKVVGSCDGLVLLVNEDNEKYLVNPITVHHSKVPDSPLALHTWEGYSMYGFGYDSCIDDYKIVTLSHYVGDMFNTFVDVYYVKKGVWKRVESSPYDQFVPDLSYGDFLNGAIHWLADNSRGESSCQSVIAAFDLAHEVFFEIPVPDSVKSERFKLPKLAVIGGCLCILDAPNLSQTDLWIMKEYGKTESWTLFGIGSDAWNFVKPLCSIGDEEVVFMRGEETVVVQNLKEGASRDMVVDGVPAIFMAGGIFTESLLSPDFI